MKLFYTIGEVAEMFNVNTSLLRYWESEFPQLKPHKTTKGTRSYTEKDIALLRRIYHLTKECGYTLDGAREQLRLSDNTDLAIQKLLDARHQLLSLQQSLNNPPTE